MAIIINTIPPLQSRFFGPMLDLLPNFKSFRVCPKISDSDWLTLGICRVIESVLSGRDFLQSMKAKLHVPCVGRFFSSLKSKRRLAVCAEANEALCAIMTQTVPDVFREYSQLDDFDLYAADGHAHAHATHDPAKPSKSSATGFAKFGTSHIYTLDLRTHALSHLALADQISRRKEHEMRTLKRLEIDQMRQGAPPGRKVLYLYDPACIDYTYWYQLKRKGIYFVTVMKSNASLTRCGSYSYDINDPINAGVLFDDQVGIAGIMVRQIQYQCPQTGEIFEFLTNEINIPPGLIARLYRMRWDIEKTYDEVKNKFQEKKAWASSATAKTMQAWFICLAHNLMVIQEHKLRTEEGVTNTSEIKRKAKRLQTEIERLAEKNEVLPVLLRDFQRLTQRSVKYIRWLRAFLFVPAPWINVVAALRESYAIS